MAHAVAPWPCIPRSAPPLGFQIVERTEDHGRVELREAPHMTAHREERTVRTHRVPATEQYASPVRILMTSRKREHAPSATRNQTRPALLAPNRNAVPVPAGGPAAAEAYATRHAPDNDGPDPSSEPTFSATASRPSATSSMAAPPPARSDEPSPPAGLRRPETGRHQPGSERRDRRRHRLRSDHETGLHAPGLDHRHRRDGRSTNSNRRGPARVESRQRTERSYAAREPRRREEDQPEPSPRRAAHPAGERRAHRDFETVRRNADSTRNTPRRTSQGTHRAYRPRNPAEQAASKRPATGTHRVFRDTDTRRASRAHRPKSRTPANRRRAYRPRKRAPRKRSATPGTKGQNPASNRARHREARLSVPERLFRARSTRPDGRPDNANAGAAPHPHARRYARNFNCPSASSWMTSIS